MTELRDFSVAGFTHIGGRDENQDRYCLLSDPETNRLMIVVADGMGGHSGGALAAQTIIDTATTSWDTATVSWRENSGETDPETLLHQFINDCQSAVYKAGQENNLDARSTIVILYIFPQEAGLRAISIHAGDCRVIQYSHNALVKQSIDHSLAQFHVLQGKITQEEVANHPDQSTVLSCIGGKEGPEPEITHWDLSQGDRFVVCSDGFWEIFSGEDTLRLFEFAGKTKGNGDLENSTLAKAIESRFLEKLQKLENPEKLDNVTTTLLNMHTNVPPANPARAPIWLVWSIIAAAVIAAIVLTRNHSDPAVDPSPPDPKAADTLLDSDTDPLIQPAVASLPQNNPQTGESARQSPDKKPSEI